MDHSRPPSINDDNPYALDSSNTTPNKRRQNGEHIPPAKRVKSTVEEPQTYSDAVRKKLASTSRTGQACDRCKERKMKCDSNPICLPCAQKNLRCYTTDRVTGQTRERGQTDRTESELQYLRDQHAAYRRKYGELRPEDLHVSPFGAGVETDKEPRPYLPLQSERRRDTRDFSQTCLIPSSQYVGWPAPSHIEELHHGPVNGTMVNVLDGVIDIADFDCELMRDYPQDRLNIFNMSRVSIVNTIMGHQTIVEPRLPPKEDAIRDANSFLIIMSQYVPVVHRPSFIQMVHRIYDRPSVATLAERVQLVVALGIVACQTAVRNHSQAAEKFEQSNYWIHYGLTWYRELLRERSLSSMQALTLILVQFRNLPKPGYAWLFAHDLLVKVMELEYHRDPDKIVLPPNENNVLAKELRKRVFHAILGICVTTGCRVSRPAPWQFQHMDVPLPMAIRDDEISEAGLAENLSGKSDFWPCIQVAKLLPLLTEMYNYVASVRRSESEYLKTVEALHIKIDAWRRDWDKSIEHDENHINLRVATLLIETWAAEYTLNLYHPSVCSSRSPEVMERHLDICHKQAQRLLKSFHTLSAKYKGVDFTWHSTAAYAMGFGVTLHVYHQRKGRLSPEQTEAMKNELKGWMSLVAYADLVMRTGNHLQHMFEPRVSRLEDEYRELLTTTPITQNSQYPNSMPPTSHISSQPFIKTETSPGHSMYGGSSKGVDSVVIPQRSQLQMTYPPNVSAPQWSSSMQYIPHTASVPPFGSYGNVADTYQHVPTSLAPLLNESSSGYMSYPTPTTMPQGDMMMFTPSHYSEGPMAWPLSTLSPQDQACADVRDQG